MWCETAVGIHHQLTARESGIRFKAALRKSAGRIDEDLRFGIQREVLKSGLDNMAHDRMAKLRQLHTILMLAGDHYGRDTLGNAELILHRHLRLTVRLQAGDRAQLSRLGQQAGEPRRRDLASRDDLTCGSHDLTGYMGGGVMLQTGIHYGVGNGVAELVRVALSDRLRG